MEIYSSPKAYVFNLHTTSSSEARRLWRRKIREKWGYKCAYCGSEEDLTIDHVVPRAKGGHDVPTIWYVVAIHVIKIKHTVLGKNGIFNRSFLPYKGIIEFKIILLE